MKLSTRIKHVLGRSPVMFPPCFRIAGSKHAVAECLYAHDTEIVIEGFPRSANTYAVVAFRDAQSRDVRIAHHLHVEAHVLLGVAAKKPVLVLIRDPKDAIRSLRIRHDELSLHWCVQRYLEFYSTVQDVLDDVVLADFSEVVADFGAVIQRINKKFETDYKPFDGAPEKVASVFQAIDAINEQADDGRMTHVSRPVLGRADSFEVGARDEDFEEAFRLYRALKPAMSSLK